MLSCSLSPLCRRAVTSVMYRRRARADRRGVSNGLLAASLGPVVFRCDVTSIAKAANPSCMRWCTTPSAMLPNSLFRNTASDVNAFRKCLDATIASAFPSRSHADSNMFMPYVDGVSFHSGCSSVLYMKSRNVVPV